MKPIRMRVHGDVKEKEHKKLERSVRHNAQIPDDKSIEFYRDDRPPTEAETQKSTRGGASTIDDD